LFVSWLGQFDYTQPINKDFANENFSFQTANFNFVTSDTINTALIDIPINAITTLESYKSTIALIPNGELILDGLDDFKDILALGTNI